MMEQFWQCIMDLSANHVSRYGFYLPGDEYTLVLWSESLAVMLSFALLVVMMKVARLKRMLARAQSEAERRSPEPAQAGPAREFDGERSRFRSIYGAIGRGSNLVLLYRGAGGELSGREIEPLFVYRSGAHLYLHAYCHLRRDLREFRLDRIISITSAQDAGRAVASC